MENRPVFDTHLRLMDAEDDVREAISEKYKIIPDDEYDVPAITREVFDDVDGVLSPNALAEHFWIVARKHRYT